MTQAPGRWVSFHASENSDGTYHVLVIAADGGYIFADRFNSEEEAKWACALFNAAIGYGSAGAATSSRTPSATATAMALLGGAV